MPAIMFCREITIAYQYSAGLISSCLASLICRWKLGFDRRNWPATFSIIFATKKGKIKNFLFLSPSNLTDVRIINPGPGLNEN